VAGRAAIIAREGKALTVLEGIGPSLARRLHAWFEAPPQASIRHRFVASFSRAQARRILVEKPEWHRLSNGDLQKHTV
jgi:hypothetical protein